MDHKTGSAGTGGPIAIKSNSKFILNHFGGKRTEVTYNHFLNQVFEKLPLPTPDTPIIAVMDDNPQYREDLVRLYYEPCVTYGQAIKLRKEDRLDAVIWEEPAEKGYFDISYQRIQQQDSSENQSIPKKSCITHQENHSICRRIGHIQVRK